MPFSPFRREDGDGGQVRVRLDLDAEEREVLAQVLRQVHDLLADPAGEGSGDPLAEIVGFDPSGGTPEPPEDPAVARLLPDGHRADPEVALEFRRLTEWGLRRRKRQAIARAVEALRPGEICEVVLALDDVRALLTAMTDARLVLAERLGLRTDDDAARLSELLRDLGGGRHPWVATAVLYEVLTEWQDSLVQAVDS